MNPRRVAFASCVMYSWTVRLQRDAFIQREHCRMPKTAYRLQPALSVRIYRASALSSVRMYPAGSNSPFFQHTSRVIRSYSSLNRLATQQPFHWNGKITSSVIQNPHPSSTPSPLALLQIWLSHDPTYSPVTSLN